MKSLKVVCFLCYMCVLTGCVGHQTSTHDISFFLNNPDFQYIYSTISTPIEISIDPCVELENQVIFDDKKCKIVLENITYNDEKEEYDLYFKCFGYNNSNKNGYIVSPCVPFWTEDGSMEIQSSNLYVKPLNEYPAYYSYRTSELACLENNFQISVVQIQEEPFDLEQSSTSLIISELYRIDFIPYE